MQSSQIHSNKSFIGLRSQSAEYAAQIGQDNLCRAGAELGRRVSASPRPQASKPRSARVPETSTGTWLFPYICEVVAYGSEYLGQLLPRFAACERAGPGPELRVLQAGRAAPTAGAVVPLLLPALLWQIIRRYFPFLCGRTQGSLTGGFVRRLLVPRALHGMCMVRKVSQGPDSAEQQHCSRNQNYHQASLESEVCRHLCSLSCWVCASETGLRAHPQCTWAFVGPPIRAGSPAACGYLPLGQAPGLI